MLSLWLRVLESDPAALAHYRRRFRHILVDEFQDTNRLQNRSSFSGPPFIQSRRSVITSSVGRRVLRAWE
ncbi:MAG: UvrD-helicase domain-containing protein [Verrucomicrobiota bacterium]